MVKHTQLLFITLLACQAGTASAVFQRTARDLQVLEDDLRAEIAKDENFARSLTPMLIAPPKHVWRESRLDFRASVMNVLANVFTEKGALIDCQTCDTHRLFVQNENRLLVNNGELGVADFEQLREKESFRDAKTMAQITETPSGVEMRVTSIADGRVLYLALADSTQQLNQVTPYMNYSQELRRRKMGEALAYVFINIGVYPEGLFQMEWLEQFGSRNQHVAGLGISLFNPIFSIGGVYHYMFPGHTRFNVAGSVYYPLQNALGEGAADAADEDTGGLVLQAMAQYAITDTFGMFASLSTRGTFSIGVNMFNPLLLPFML